MPQDGTGASGTPGCETAATIRRPPARRRRAFPDHNRENFTTVPGPLPIASVLPFNGGRRQRARLRNPSHPPMWTLPRTDLKYRLTLRIAAVAAFCFAATAAYALFDADRSARARIDAVAALAAKDLELQHSKLDWVKVNGQPSGSPDLQTIAPALMAPGLCIAYRAASGEILQRFCGGTQGVDAHPPAAFAALYRTL